MSEREIHPPIDVDSRAEWQRTEGFILHTDVSDRVLVTLENNPIYYPLTPSEVDKAVGNEDALVQEHPSAAAMFVFMKRAYSQVYMIRQSASFFDAHGVSAQDRQRAAGRAYNAGFADVDFTWHFAPLLANACVDTFVDHGVIAQEQKNILSFGDWANIICSGWFASLTQQLALTKNTIYANLGKDARHYEHNVFKNSLSTKT